MLITSKQSNYFSPQKFEIPNTYVGIVCGILFLFIRSVAAVTSLHADILRA